MNSGDVVDRRYLLGREIARGGVGTVFAAQHQVTGRMVALKLLHRRSTAVHKRFLREAKLVGAARHLGIVELLDAGVCDSAGPYLALELLHGRPLDGILASRGRLSTKDTVHIGRQICTALAVAHRKGIVHRDLKPSNVFIARSSDGTEVVKVLDFGVAALMEPMVEQTKLTREAELVGTPEYMAPELLLGQPFDHRCDVYAAGVTLFECATGKLPYEGNFGLINALATGEPPPSSRSVCADVPEGLANVLQVALTRSVEHRYQSVGALRQALIDATGFNSGATGLLRGLGDTDPEPNDEPSQRPEPERAKTLPLPPFERSLECTTEDARNHLRVPYMTPVRLTRTHGEAVPGRTEDIGIGGMLVIAEGPVEEGESFVVMFVLPDRRELLQLNGLCRWVRAGTHSFAVGIEFVDPPPFAQMLLGKFIQSGS